MGEENGEGHGLMYSSRSKSWKLWVVDTLMRIFSRELVVFSNEALHWEQLGFDPRSPKTKYVFAFNMANGSCHLLPLPSEVAYMYSHMDLNFERKLAFMCPKLGTTACLQFWVMDEYGSSSWRNFFELDVSDLLDLRGRMDNVDDLETFPLYVGSARAVLQFNTTSKAEEDEDEDLNANMIGFEFEHTSDDNRFYLKVVKEKYVQNTSISFDYDDQTSDGNCF